MQDKKMRRIASWVIVLLIVAIVVASLWNYTEYIKKITNESMHTTLEENVMQQAFNFSSTIGVEKDSLKMLGRGILDSPDPNDISNMLSRINEGTAFDHIVAVGIDGLAKYPNGHSVDVSQTDYFLRAMNGEIVVSDPIQSEIRDAKVVIIATPLQYDGEVVGVLLGSYLADELDNLFLESFGGKGYAYIATDDGEIVAKSLNDYSLATTNNLFDIFDKAEFFDYDTLAEMKEKLKNNEAGHIKYNIDGNTRIAHFMPVGINDWNIFSVVPDIVVTENANKIISLTSMMSITFIGVFVLFIIYVVMIQRKNTKKLERIAYEDDLTGVPTLAKFKIDAQKLLDDHPNMKFVLVKNDVDKFKLLNRTCGFETGDQVLKNMAKAFAGCVFSKNFVVARFNIDEFIFLHEFSSMEKLSEQKRRYDALFKELMGDGFSYNIHFVSGHYHLYRDDCRDINVAIERVNTAHRCAKNTGVSMVVYDEKLLEDALRKKEIENRMEHALAHGEFKVFLQPKYRLNDERLIGAEALVRWEDGERGLLYPGAFISIFEGNGFIVKLDMYMFKNTCQLIRGWMQRGLQPVPVSVNFSRLHLANKDFIPALCEIADHYQVPHQLLEIELTETAILDNEKILFSALKQLHTRGFTVSMDDFGIGYSSLGLLKNIPVDEIKIDRSFFIAAENKSRTKFVLACIIDMAKHLDIKTVAEGVETNEHIELLRTLGCDIVQGYYYAKPMPEKEFEKNLDQADQ